MGKEATVTQQMINAAADALIATGQKVTNRSVLEQVGRGSMATIVKLLQIWRAGQVKNHLANEESLDINITRSIHSMLSSRIEEATKEVNAKVLELQNDLGSVIGENERQISQIEILEAEVQILRCQVQTQDGTIDQLLKDAEHYHQVIAEESKKRESAQVELAKAALRIESLPELLIELKEARLEVKRTSQEAAELRGRLAGIGQNYVNS